MVECVGLENRFTRKGNEGSNPSLSAQQVSSILLKPLLWQGFVRFLAVAGMSRHVLICPRLSSPVFPLPVLLPNRPRPEGDPLGEASRLTAEAVAS